MQEIARLLMTTWSMSAVQDMILRDRSLAGVSTALLVLFAYGLISLFIAVRLFRYGMQAVPDELLSLIKFLSRLRFLVLAPTMNRDPTAIRKSRIGWSS
jgi:hypothetical protein